MIIITRVFANSKHTSIIISGQRTVVQLNMCAIAVCVLWEGGICFSNVTKCGTHEICIFSTGTECSCDEIPVPTPLSKYHYYIIIYVAVSSIQWQCATCSTSLMYITSKACPKPDNMILKYLTEYTGFEGESRSQDRVCITCYNPQQVYSPSKCLAYK